ncbi:serine hydrolase domain-containing protein [Pseudoalteromonas sp. T1lg48]|uniref:serine hydrolase domain-containing protein n=1 Tax=Pseudoalteromonas sp. T1lg48 TaxID=2077100 RepID=UPI000CF6AE86|nr:serine hydrolase domain-containing protein [Pseudoalteromonas sp. T1lg48]
MKTKSLVAFFCFFLSSLVPAYGASIGSDARQWHGFVDSYVADLERQLKQKRVPGAALSIVHPDYPSIALGFGKTKIRRGRQVDVNTRFRLASVSKTFAGSLAAKLAEQGVIELDAPVYQYIPELRGTDYKNTLKVSHLLSHSSGLVPNAYDNLVESRMSYPDIVEKLLKVEPVCEPGECYGYQNVMFSLVGDVIERASGKDYETWVREDIFQPLRMRHASLGYEGMIADENYAYPHVRGRKRWHTARLKKNYYKVLPAAGVNASAADMVQWLKAQLGMYPSVLPPAALQTQVQPYTLTSKERRRRVWGEHVNEAYYGLGWRIYQYDNETIYYHSGWVQGYRTDIVVIPRLNVGFSLLINAETGLINELTTQFIDQLLSLPRVA